MQTATDPATHVYENELPDLVRIEVQRKNVLVEEQVSQLHGELIAAAEMYAQRSSPARYCIDFSRTDHLSSQAIGALFDFKTITQRGNMDIALIVGRQIAQVFKITRINRIFGVYDSRTDFLNNYKPLAPRT